VAARRSYAKHDGLVAPDHPAMRRVNQSNANDPVRHVQQDFGAAHLAHVPCRHSIGRSGNDFGNKVSANGVDRDAILRRLSQQSRITLLRPKGSCGCLETCKRLQSEKGGSRVHNHV
jgi:hypothetical protein